MVYHIGSLFFLWLCLLFCLTLLDAFPDHLYGPVGCSTELATDEVIMNSLITAFADSRDPAITTVVLAPDGITELESPIVVSKVPMTVTMIVRNPNNLGGVQYAMDVTENSGASFEHGQCNGQKRVGGRPGDRHVLTIEKIPETTIQVWAGWACSHEAVTLTNYFEFTGQERGGPNSAGSGVTDTIEQVVEQVLDLEHADQHERQDLQAELGDDDATNAGDLEEQLDTLHADKDVRESMRHLLKDRANWQEKDSNSHLSNEEMEKYRDLMMEKKRLPLNAVKNVDWDQVKKRLVLSGHGPNMQETKMAEHQRLMRERRERTIKENAKFSERQLKDIARRGGIVQERFEERKALFAHKLKAPLPNDAEEREEVDTVNSDSDRQRGRKSYEDQESDVLVKEILIGLLGVLLANWLLVQLCLWNDKRNKGRRDL